MRGGGRLVFRPGWGTNFWMRMKQDNTQRDFFEARGNVVVYCTQYSKRYLYSTLFAREKGGKGV